MTGEVLLGRDGAGGEAWRRTLAADTGRESVRRVWRWPRSPGEGRGRTPEREAPPPRAVLCGEGQRGDSGDSVWRARTRRAEGPGALAHAPSGMEATGVCSALI